MANEFPTKQLHDAIMNGVEGSTIDGIHNWGYPQIELSDRTPDIYLNFVQQIGNVEFSFNDFVQRATLYWQMLFNDLREAGIATVITRSNVDHVRDGCRRGGGGADLVWHHIQITTSKVRGIDLDYNLWDTGYNGRQLSAIQQQIVES